MLRFNCKGEAGVVVMAGAMRLETEPGVVTEVVGVCDVSLVKEAASARGST